MTDNRPKTSKRPGRRPTTFVEEILAAVLPVLLSVLESICSFFFQRLNTAVTILEVSSSRLFGLASRLLGIPPCGTYKPEDSAVLILGVQEGIGRSAALRFSELGYTVFALCPNEYEGGLQGSQMSSDGRRHVSSLLYIWHNRKERSRSLPWGLLAPVSLDVWSTSQRQRAVETVQAYCAKYTLRLVALVISPVPGCNSLSPYMSLYRLAARGVDTCTSCSAEEERWRKRILSQVTEPILMAHDYTWLLRQASGRIIVISPCSEDGLCDFGFSIEEARRAVCQHLCGALQPLGIRVISIITGPLEEASSRPFSDRLVVGCRGQDFDTELLRSIDSRTQSEHATAPIVRPPSVKDDEILRIAQEVVQSRHPKLVYTIGALPVLRAALKLVPANVLLTFKWLSFEILSRNDFMTCWVEKRGSE
ncbi:hypothetical protein DENSPDRAFT_841562 [Dentipellis sp. KUC8613]|nr:hypothetical protein DENSPDRAFT_841562 [Dentipellis sp. KUC8613]